MTIQILDNIPDLIALQAVTEVVREGKISGIGDKRQYCYAMSFHSPVGELFVYTKPYRKSPCFRVCKAKCLNP